MLNKIQIIGNVGKDSETRYMANGEAMTTFSVATKETWKDKNSGEKKEATEWHNVSFFGKLAEIAGEYVKKGTLIYVEGSIKTRKFTDKEGIEKYATGIKGDNFKLLGGKAESVPQTQPQQRPAQRQEQQPKPSAPSNADDWVDDIPF
jgi:single-strand DNA-binding protein